MTEIYCIEHNGDCWQSVFPTREAHLSQLHVTIEDALAYMVGECNIPKDEIYLPGDEREAL